MSNRSWYADRYSSTTCQKRSEDETTFITPPQKRHQGLRRTRRLFCSSKNVRSRSLSSLEWLIDTREESQQLDSSSKMLYDRPTARQGKAFIDRRYRRRSTKTPFSRIEEIELTHWHNRQSFEQFFSFDEQARNSELRQSYELTISSPSLPLSPPLSLLSYANSNVQTSGIWRAWSLAWKLQPPGLPDAVQFLQGASKLPVDRNHGSKAV